MVGIDSAPSAIARARRDYGERVEFHIADATTTSAVADAAADLVVVINLLHLLTQAQNRQALYRHMCRLLRPGGLGYFENNGSLHARRTQYLAGGHTELRTIRVPEGEQKIPLTRLPTVMLNGRTLRRELRRAEWTVLHLYASVYEHPDTPREQMIAVVRK